MSIYATLEVFGVEILGVNGGQDKLYKVAAQGVPSHIDYEGEIWNFLPPPVDKNSNEMRAVFFVLNDYLLGTQKGTEKNGQEYVDPLWVVTGKKYNKLKFSKTIKKLEKKIRKKIELAEQAEQVERVYAYEDDMINFGLLPIPIDQA